MLRRGRHLQQHQFPFHGRDGGQVDHAEHVDQLVELLGHLLEGAVVALHHHGEPGDASGLGGPHRQAFDVEAPAGEQPGDATQRPRLVFNQHREGVLHRRGSIGRAGHPSVRLKLRGRPANLGQPSHQDGVKRLGLLVMGAMAAVIEHLYGQVAPQPPHLRGHP